MYPLGLSPALTPPVLQRIFPQASGFCIQVALHDAKQVLSLWLPMSRDAPVDPPQGPVSGFLDAKLILYWIQSGGYLDQCLESCFRIQCQMKGDKSDLVQRRKDEKKNEKST